MTKKTLFLNDADFCGHDMGERHPESPKRVQAILNRMMESPAKGLLEWAGAKDLGAQSDEAVHALHGERRWAEIAAKAPLFGTVELAPEAIMSRGTLRAIRLGVGASLEAVDRVCLGKNPNAFAAIRPPGHHATTDEPMGFCFVNNAALAARRALDVHGLSRVAIVDIDVHHGNGTEEIVARDPRMFMASTYGIGIYPGNGHAPLGANMENVGLEPRIDHMAMRRIVEGRVFPALISFAPELIVVSAGYDAHWQDPLGNQRWVDEDYHWWFSRLCEISKACAGGKLVALLEGGYNTEALARSVEQSLLAMTQAAAGS